jgi:hypothetical protein
MSQWRYVEESVLRVLAGWGRCAGDWEDKLAMCYHVWLQAEVVRTMRERLVMYPGGKADPAVHRSFQELMDAVILAPSWPDAMAALHTVVMPALARAYDAYRAASHPIHDRPTFDVLHAVAGFKREQSEWYEGFKKRHPHTLDAAYRERIEAKLSAIGEVGRVIEVDGEPAAPCGKQTDFRMPITPGRVKDWDKAPNIMPMIELDWSTSVEARRLFFMIGYCWEMGVAEQQLRWIYHADFMPFEFIHAEARHMWDESRHGDSGYSRLKDFGLDFEHFGYSSYGVTGDGMLESMAPATVYEAFYGVTQIAETGYFETKRYCFDDFRTARDERSAEMMQFDIIDETSHVEYGRIWLDEMAKRAGVQEDYRQRGATDRAAAKRRAIQRVEASRAIMQGAQPVLPTGKAHGGDAVNPGAVVDPQALADPRAWSHYRWLLSELNGQCPLRHNDPLPVRPFLPM